MENLLWGLLDGIIAWPTLIVNVFGGDYQVFQDHRGIDMLEMRKTLAA